MVNVPDVSVKPFPVVQLVNAYWLGGVSQVVSGVETVTLWVEPMSHWKLVLSTCQ